MEYWDLYDKNRNPLNKVCQRGIPLNDDEYHIVVSVVTINSQKEILITHRDPSKKIYPNMWEITAGSVISGESSRNAALRELFEETGIKAFDNELINIDTVMGTTKGRYSFVDIYMVKKDIEIKKLKMQPGETTAAKWVSFSKFDEMANEGKIASSSVKRFGIIRNTILEKMVAHNNKLYESQYLI